MWVSDVLGVLEKLEPETAVGLKRGRDDEDKPARAKSNKAAGLVLDVQDLSSEHAIDIRVQVAPGVLSHFMDVATLTDAPTQVESDDLLIALGLRNTHSTSNMHGLVKPALTQARDEQVKVPRGPWTKELGGQEELLTLDVWRNEAWILKMQRTSTLFVLLAKYRIATYLRRLAFEREVLRRRHLKKREVWRFLSLVHGKQLVIDERPLADIEADLRALSFATNSELSLAFAGEEAEDDKDETNPFKYLLDLPRSLSVSEKWRRLEAEVQELMREYVAKLEATVWDEWTRDLELLASSVQESMVTKAIRQEPEVAAKKTRAKRSK